MMSTTPPISGRTSSIVRSVLLWSISFLIIPLAGYLGTFLVGRIDNLASALAGGAIVGALVGLGQAVASRGRLPKLRWTLATTIGTGLGVAAGSLAVGYRTTLTDLIVGGAITGLVVGLGQTLALPARTRLRWVWLPAMAALWPSAWAVTTLAGIKVEEQFIVFGASGASVYTVLAGILLYVLLPPVVALSAKVGPSAVTP
jgi:hypothetical protein